MKICRAKYTRHDHPPVEIENHNVVTDGRNLFDQLVKNVFITYANIRKIATGQAGNYTTACLLD